MGNGCSILFSNEYYGSDYINNNLLIFALNKNIFHISRGIKIKKKDLNITYLWYYRLGHISQSE